MDYFTIPDLDERGGSRPFPKDAFPVGLRDPRVRRLFSQAALAGKARTTVPIRAIGEDGVVDLFRPGDEVPYAGSLESGQVQQMAASLAVFHLLGWWDEPHQSFPVAAAYHSFLLVFDFDAAPLYERLSTARDEHIDKRTEHYIRANYWFCRVRLCDFVKGSGRWVNCSPAEAYKRARMAVKHVLTIRADMCSVPGAIHGATVGVYPPVPGVDYANALFGARHFDVCTGPSVPHYGALISATKRANNAAIAAYKANRRAAPPPLVIKAAAVAVEPAAVPPPVEQIRLGVGRLGVSFTIPTAVRAAGESIRADGDESAYASEWEELMRTYDPKQEAEARAKHIAKEMLARGYVPKTTARSMASAYED